MWRSLRLTVSFAALLLGACASQPAWSPPTLDESAVDCAYKWFQSGHSPVTLLDCDAPREQLAAEGLRLAERDAWRIARQRCPESCPPEALTEPAPAPLDRAGVCREGRVYFVNRIFVRCARPN